MGKSATTSSFEKQDILKMSYWTKFLWKVYGYECIFLRKHEFPQFFLISIPTVLWGFLPQCTIEKQDSNGVWCPLIQNSFESINPFDVLKYLLA